MLPEDRADILYHSYDGGGVEITGPSLLVLKKVGQDVAVSGNYYVDSVSSASIDVVTSGQQVLRGPDRVFAGVDYLHGNSTMSLSWTNSDENDYQANTAGLGVSMDMFGNMTTVTMGYLRSWDTVENNTRLFGRCGPAELPARSHPGHHAGHADGSEFRSHHG